MHCSFTLSKADLAALHKVVGRRLNQLSKANTKLFFVNFFTWIPLGVAFAGYAALYRRYPEMSYDIVFVAIAFGMGVSLMIAGMFYKQRMYRSVMLSSNSWFLSEQSVDLNAEGVVVKVSYGLVNYSWSAFQHLEQDNNNLYLFIDNTQAFILPKAVLEPDQLVQVKAWLNRV